MKDLFDRICELDEIVDDLGMWGYADEAQVIRDASFALKGYVELRLVEPEQKRVEGADV